MDHERETTNADYCRRRRRRLALICYSSQSACLSSNLTQARKCSSIKPATFIKLTAPAEAAIAANALSLPGLVMVRRLVQPAQTGFSSQSSSTDHNLLYFFADSHQKWTKFLQPRRQILFRCIISSPPPPWILGHEDIRHFFFMGARLSLSHFLSHVA